MSAKSLPPTSAFLKLNASSSWTSARASRQSRAPAPHRQRSRAARRAHGVRKLAATAATRARNSFHGELLIVGGVIRDRRTLRQKGERFVPRLMFRTRPPTSTDYRANMGGKSTYLRQSALIILRPDGFVRSRSPGQAAITDRIFTRIGASDNPRVAVRRFS